MWGAITVSGWLLIENAKHYTLYRKAYLASTDSDPYNDTLLPFLTNEQLFAYMLYYRRNLELSIVFAVGVYLLQIADAVAYAHLFKFDISDELSLSAHLRGTSAMLALRLHHRPQSFQRLPEDRRGHHQRRIHTNSRTPP